MLKKYIILSLVAVMSLGSLTPALAHDGNDKGNNGKREVAQAKKELKKEIKEERKEMREEVRDEVKDKLEALKKALKFTPRSLSFTAKLVSVSNVTTTPSSTEIVVSVARVFPVRHKQIPTSTINYPEKDKNITLKISDKTTLVRAYGGKMKLSEMAVGDQLHIVAKFNADGSLDVRVLRDNSLHIILHKSGMVESINTSDLSFVLKQSNRVLTVNTDGETKFYMKRTTTTSFADLKVGDKVSVEGIINLNSKTVKARSVTISKRAPVAPTSTPTPTSTPADTTPPTGTISINAGATTTTLVTTTLTLSATDNASGVAQMRFSNDGVNFSAPVQYVTSASWTLASGNGLKTVYVQYRDGAGNWSSAVIADTIELSLAI
ncbi:MAG: hypothetical protein A2534_03750 [Candidatus Magasanikbacteria bacterium RIFOXYD2_FULL_39_9]|uniref:DUF5666 domain-containing protein n=1 Tax=Candidatus Magasanikbacteria bacterium RIFOXYD1_FULL_40_23 TaxID=1798705 RepID=A0A1F6PAI4_9BACT|nr:MAG: hypothetical protein A2534_03750 [Candidatus Magasanikbacteria bacterium RIFOXYD2_FULL_39_9]OGH93195.1 MAG: hypothetical protein A2563_01150 [Candidatus Magasanikbacteria bacterium RIFOXYD1_FULL_40_23]